MLNQLAQAPILPSRRLRRKLALTQRRRSPDCGSGSRAAMACCSDMQVWYDSSMKNQE